MAAFDTDAFDTDAFSIDAFSFDASVIFDGVVPMFFHSTIRHPEIGYTAGIDTPNRFFSMRLRDHVGFRVIIPGNE